MTRIIVLNGSSSSGKSTLARALQQQSGEVLLHFSIDAILYALPPRQLQRLMTGQDPEGIRYDDLVAGYYATLKQLADAGLSVISDNAITARRRAEQLVRAVDGHDVLLVGLDCPVHVLEQREAARGDRRPGLARAQAATIHRWLVYDVLIDTETTPPEASAAIILRETRRTGFERTKQMLAGKVDDGH